MQLCVAGRTIVLDDSNAFDEPAPIFSETWLGTELWPAASALVTYLEQERRPQVASTSLVLELGAGTGACGLAAAALGARQVLLTDKLALLPVLRANVTANGFDGQVRCEVLEWTDNGSADGALSAGAELILVSDCLNPVYGSEHAGALATTICGALSHAQRAGCQRPEALLAQTRRGEEVAESSFFAACTAIGLVVTLLRKERGGDQQQHTVAIYSVVAV